MSLTIQDLGSLGELLGSVAVLATLVYLALQTRQNTMAIGSQLGSCSSGNPMRRSRSWKRGSTREGGVSASTRETGRPSQPPLREGREPHHQAHLRAQARHGAAEDWGPGSQRTLLDLATTQ